MTLLSVPVIDVSPFLKGGAEGKRAVSHEIDRACEDIGFLVISGHGISTSLLDDVKRTTREFFDLSLDEKMKVARPAPDVSRGYVEVEGESVGRSRDQEAYSGDLNESFMIGPVDTYDSKYVSRPEAGKHFAPNLWPALPADLRDVYSTYYREMSKLAASLMSMFAVALRIDEDYFVDKIDKAISRLRVRNYPAPLLPPEPGQLRAGAHSDYGSLTILSTEDRPGGLQVWNAAEEWVDVPIIPDCFIVNIGDLMARWTNDQWVSTLHRVVNPGETNAAESRRQSIVFFHNPNYDATIECVATCIPEGEEPKYEVTTSGDHLRRLFIATQNTQDSGLKQH
jgi:isopenicillin N synthase-like dioxygenase